MDLKTTGQHIIKAHAQDMAVEAASKIEKHVAGFDITLMESYETFLESFMIKLGAEIIRIKGEK